MQLTEDLKELFSIVRTLLGAPIRRVELSDEQLCDILKVAIEQSGWAIQYAKNPSEDLQVLAIKKDFDAIKYIKNPSEEAQKEAVKINYTALRYIDNPCMEAKILAIKNSEAAISFIKDSEKEDLLEFLRVNFLVIKYISKKIEKEDLEIVLKDVLSKEDVDEKYVRDFLTCNIIDRNSSTIDMDKIMFIYKLRPTINDLQLFNPSIIQ